MYWSFSNLNGSLKRNDRCFQLNKFLYSSVSDIIPYFTQEPTSAVIPPGGSLTLSCHVHPPDSVVRWLFNGDFVENENSYGLEIEGTDLVIPSMAADNSDNGVYQCSAQNSHGTILSRRAKVSKAGKVTNEYLNFNSNLLMNSNMHHLVM